MFCKVKSFLYSIGGLFLIYLFPSAFLRAGKAEAAELPQLGANLPAVAVVVQKQPVLQPSVLKDLKDPFESPAKSGDQKLKTYSDSPSVCQDDPEILSVASVSYTAASVVDNSHINESSTNIELVAPTIEQQSQGTLIPVSAPIEKTKSSPKKFSALPNLGKTPVQQILGTTKKPIFPTVVQTESSSVTDFFSRLNLQQLNNIFLIISNFQSIQVLMEVFPPQILTHLKPLPFPSIFNHEILSQLLEKSPDIIRIVLGSGQALPPKFKLEIGHIDFFEVIGLLAAEKQVTTLNNVFKKAVQLLQRLGTTTGQRVSPHITPVPRSTRTYGPVPSSVRSDWRSFIHRPEFLRRLIPRLDVKDLPKEIAHNAGIYFQGEILDNGLVTAYIGKTKTSLGNRTSGELTAVENDLQDWFSFWFKNVRFFQGDYGQRLLQIIKNRFLNQLATKTRTPERCHNIPWFMAAVSRFPAQFLTGEGNFLGYPAFFKKWVEVPGVTVMQPMQDFVIRALETFAIREFLTHQTVFSRRLPTLTYGLVPEGAIVLLLNQSQLSGARKLPYPLLKELICLSRDQVTYLIVNYGWTWEKTALLYDPSLNIQSVEDFKRELLLLRRDEILGR
jgi:hypothetical protein